MCNPKGLGGSAVCKISLYTPLESGFTGKSLTIPDFVRGNLFTEFGEFLFCSPEYWRLTIIPDTLGIGRIFVLVP